MKEGEKMEIKCTVEEIKELLNNKTPVAGKTDVKITANIISDAINVKFIKLKAKIDKLVSRKEIIKIIRAIYKK